jgi:hypothetical protein
MMPVDIDCLTIKDLKMLLHWIHAREGMAKEVEVKRLAEEAVACEAEQLVAEAAAQKAEEEAKEKARRVKKATVAKKWEGMEVVGNRSDVEPRPSWEKGKSEGEGRECRVHAEELGNVCQQVQLLFFVCFVPFC